MKPWLALRGGESPDEMFETAWQADEAQGVELEIRAIEMAIEQFPHNIDTKFLAVNASAKTIIAMRGELTKDPGLAVPWPNLVVEISEKKPVEDYQILDQSLSLLRQRRVRLAIDDYGAGFSSLLHIGQIDPAFIKMDRAFIRNLDENSSKRSAVDAILHYATLERSLVIAEGIETEVELRWLTGRGIEYGQGYLLGKPKPFDNDTLE